MYMRVQYHMERSKTLHDYIDLSEYAGVELEHGHNTAGKLDMSNHSNLGTSTLTATRRTTTGTCRPRLTGPWQT